MCDPLIAKTCVSESNPHALPWVEKYRPKQLRDVKGQGHLVAQFERMLESNQPMHFLFYGPPGTGKTSTITSLCNELYASRPRDQYVLNINASYDSGIDMVRHKIKPFCKRSTATFDYKGHVIDYKFVVLDEADTLTKDAQNALRRCIEIYSYNTRFCFLCNYVTNIIAPILSRCSVCHFRAVAHDDAVALLGEVCASEEVAVTPECIEVVYRSHKGDLRASLTTLQAVHAMYDAVTVEHLQEHLFRVSDALWHLVAETSCTKSLAGVVDALAADGYSVRRLLQALVPWLLDHATDAQMYALTTMVSRLEKQALVFTDNRPLLWELVFGLSRVMGQDHASKAGACSIAPAATCDHTKSTRPQS